MRFLSSHFLFLLVLELVTTQSSAHEEFVTVTKKCPESLSEFGEIIVLSDHDDSSPYAVCRGHEFEFVAIAHTIYRLRFRHSGNAANECLSTLVDDDHYAVQVNLPLDRMMVTLNTTDKIVRCPRIFYRPPKDLAISSSADLVFQRNITSQAHNQSKSTLNTDFMAVSDELGTTTPAQEPFELSNMMFHADPIFSPGEKMSDEEIRIQIQGSIAESPNKKAKIQIYTLVNNPHIMVKGIFPIKCDISYDSEVKVIIDNGCSNGILIPRYTGFEIHGLMSWSPVFSIPIPRDCHVSISCSFGVCKNNCDGSSCRYNSVEIIDIYNATSDVFPAALCLDPRDVPIISKDVKMKIIPGLVSGLQNDSTDDDVTTTEKPIAEAANQNLPLIIALSILVPIVCVLFITTCLYRSKVNFGTYRVRDRTNPQNV